MLCLSLGSISTNHEHSLKTSGKVLLIEAKKGIYALSKSLVPSLGNGGLHLPSLP